MASLSTSTSNSSSPSSMPSRLQAPILPPTTTSPFSASPLSKPNGLLDHVLQRPRSASRLDSNGGTLVPAAAAIPSPPESSSSSFESMRQTNELYSRDLASLLGLTQSLHENLSLPQQTQQHLQSLLTQSESLRHTNNELLGSKVLFLRSQLKPLQTQLAQLQSDLERAQTESHQAASKVEKEWKMKLKRAEVAVEEERKLRVGWEERLGGWEVRVLELEREVEGLRGEVEKEREEKKTMAGTEEEKERERAKLERENEQLRRRVGELELAALNPRRESLPPPSHTHTSSTLNPLKRSATPAPNDDSPANSPAKHRRLTETARSETPGASGTGSTTTGSTGSRSPSAEPGNAGKSMDKKYTGGMPAVEEREGRLDFLTFWTKTTVKPNKKDGGRRTCTLCARDKSLPSPPTPTPYPANTPLDDLVAHLEAKHAQLWAIITGPGGVDGNKKRKGAVVAGGV
ncbi:hypothetical protein BDY24DRAFT_378692 [Mrakia frigida]|uniref:uncharacterized protein n=1 Tax=Mrakia frigida TaxID=29902 RepID=UPI003FCC0B93